MLSALGGRIVRVHRAAHDAGLSADTAGHESEGHAAIAAVADIHNGMGAARHRMMVYDNCRNNPADGWQQLAAQRAAALAAGRAHGWSNPVARRVVRKGA